MIHNKVEDYLCTVIEQLKDEMEFNNIDEDGQYEHTFMGLTVEHPIQWFTVHWKSIVGKICDYYVITEEECKYYIWKQLKRWVEFKVDNGHIKYSGKRFK